MEEAVGVEISDEVFEKTREQMKSKELTKVYQETVERERQKMDPTVKSVLKWFNYFNSSSFRFICIIGIIVSAIIVGFLCFSLSKWIKTIGTSLLFSGFGLLIISITVALFIKKIANFQLNTRRLSIIGIILMVVGILIVIGCKVMKKMEGKKNDLSPKTV